MSAASPAVARRPESWRQDLFVAAASIGAGLLGYAFSLVLSHSLGPSGFGELSALLAVAILAGVPGVALQAGVARGIAAAPRRADDTRMLRQSVLVAAAVGGALLAVSPLLQVVLGVRSWTDMMWLCVIMVPTTLSFGCLGVLQGRRRFIALGALLVLVQAAKLAGGVLAVLSRTGISGALVWTAVLTAVVAAGAAVVLMPQRRLAIRLRGLSGLAALRGVLARDAFALLGVLLLSNLDLVLARHYLPSHEAGLYAAGNLVTKVAFWGPSFVSTVAYPRLARPEERPAALRRGVSLLAALTGLTAIGALVFSPLLPVVVGGAYRAIEPMVWLFALQGAALAAVLLAVYAGLAVNDRRLATLVWVVAGAEVLAVALHWHDTIDQILTIVFCGSLVLLAAAGWQYRGVARRAVRSGQPSGQPSA
jgi:O-antigen/teichoic acid export membrane protein